MSSGYIFLPKNFLRTPSLLWRHLPFPSCFSSERILWSRYFKKTVLMKLRIAWRDWVLPWSGPGLSQLLWHEESTCTNIPSPPPPHRGDVVVSGYPPPHPHSISSRLPGSSPLPIYTPGWRRHWENKVSRPGAQHNFQSSSSPGLRVHTLLPLSLLGCFGCQKYFLPLI